MNENNFVERMNWISTGDFFLREFVLPLGAATVASTGVQPDASSAPTAAVNGVSYDDGNTALLTFMVPMDYDKDGDNMIYKIVGVAATDNGTNDMGITSAQTIWRPGAAADATAATAEAESATATSGLATREIFLSLSSGAGGYEPGDVLRRTIDANNSGTGEFMMLAHSIIYGSSFAAYNDDDRWRNPAFTTGD
jgi:hypothetical protein